MVHQYGTLAAVLSGTAEVLAATGQRNQDKLPVAIKEQHVGIRCTQKYLFLLVPVRETSKLLIYK